MTSRPASTDSFLQRDSRSLRPRQSLMARLVGSFLTLSVITVLFVAFVAFLEARRALSEAMFERLTAVAVEKEGELNRLVSMQSDALVFLASLEQVRRDSIDLTGYRDSGQAPGLDARKRLESLLRTATGSRSDWQELFLLSPLGGQVVASTDSRRLGAYHVNDLFYTRGKRATYIQNVYTSPTHGRPALTIATPIKNASGRTIAVLAGHVNLELVDRLIADRTGLGSTGEAYLVSLSNDFVSSQRFGREEYRRGVFSDGIAAALRGEHGRGVYLNYDGTPVIGAFRWNDDRQLALLVEMRQAEAFRPARRLVWTILGIGLASAFMLAGGVFLIARQIARPVLAITEAATAVADGDFDTVAPVMTGDEVGVLASAFNEMTARLRRLYVDLNDQVVATTDAMTALQKSKHLLQAIIDNSTTLIAVTDASGRFLLINKHFESLLGTPQGQALNRTAFDLLPRAAAEAYSETARIAFDERRVAKKETLLLVRGEQRAFFVICFPLLTDEAEPYGVGMVATDLTDLKRAQEAKRLLEAQVQHAQKLESLGLMAGGIAHDFNNILTTLLGNAELAQLQLPPDSPAERYLQNVRTATNQATDLTSQMLAYAGKGSFHQETVDLNIVLTEVSQLVKASTPKKISVQLNLSSSPATVKANRAQVIQLVMNLITNAAEAVGDRSGSVRVETTCFERPQGSPEGGGFSHSVRLSVSDTGIGMSEETRRRIFDPFFSTKGPGRGLGLAAVGGIVKSSNGELFVQSASGKGTTIEVVFPAHRDAAALHPASKETAELDCQGTVLVVDDEPMVRRMATNLLEAAGYDVVEAANGLQAVETYRAHGRSIDVVLLDMTMPGMSGAEALDAIRAIDGSARIILSSGYDAKDTIAGANHDERVAFLQKPYAARTLLAKIGQVLTAADRTSAGTASTTRQPLDLRGDA